MGETPKKYHVTDDGDVFRINEDGSFTSMGNAEKMYEPKDEDGGRTARQAETGVENKAPVKPFAETESRKRGWIYVAAVVAVLVALACFLILQRGYADSDSGVEYVDSVPVAMEETAAETPVEEAAAEEVAAEAVAAEVPAEETPVAEAPVAEAPAAVPQSYATVGAVDPERVYRSVDKEAEFPGGDRARRQWLRDNIQWPRDAAGRQLQGEVELDFIIERDGSISAVTVSRSDNPDLNAAAIRLVSSMPNWSPAMVRNQPVRSEMGITLFF